MKTTQQTKHTPAQKAAMRKQDQSTGSRMLDIDAKREALALARLERQDIL